MGAGDPGGVSKDLLSDRVEARPTIDRGVADLGETLGHGEVEVKA